MSITMYYGRAGSGKTRAVYERIRQVITECPGDPIILLVPEPATYRVERELAEFMPQGGFTTVRVYYRKNYRNWHYACRPTKRNCSFMGKLMGTLSWTLFMHCHSLH